MANDATTIGDLALPDKWNASRQIAPSPPDRGAGRYLKLLIGGVLFTAMLVGLAVYTRPNLLADWRVPPRFRSRTAKW